MNKQDYLLTCLAEECGEVTQRVTKALRFGIDEVQKGQELTNAERLTNELTDIATLIEMLREECGLWLPVYTTSKILAKKERVKEYMKLSIEQGRLEND